ncbi:sugar transferase [Sporosarcina sp. Marseille-Q4943]|uniref:sugar transferase n=1 Tax=Sporosarcina sp. Marseille-Q4943 TaxID=2942204 RepID=UPI00208DBD67|nr:sugar transferase [Sporosarcina sp. Marseille-Q4943]
MRKRVFDFSVSLIAILLLSPVFVAIALLVRWKIGTPVLFKQKRPGLNEVPFYIYKFRSMTNDTDQTGKLLPNEQRITKFGRLLRKTSLDELPQLFNVLKGDISLVGPRPLLMDYLDLYSPEQSRRHHVLPGITGWAQINGRNAISWEEKFEYDVWYVDNHSIWLDIKILLLTMKKVFKSEGVNKSENITMDKFKGSDHKTKDEIE